MDDEQEILLPIANVGRIMKQILPPTAKISKEAKQTLQESSTEFISFVTAEASDKCRKENRKTVNGDDICWALGTLGFDNYAEAIVRYLYKYREAERLRANKKKEIVLKKKTMKMMNIDVLNMGSKLMSFLSLKSLELWRRVITLIKQDHLEK